MMKSKANNSDDVRASDLMPVGEHERAILKARADHLAKADEKIIEHEHYVKYVRFKLGNREYYGIPYEWAKEVLKDADITRLPTAPNYIAGIINRRGGIIAVLDLKKYFRIPMTEQNTDSIIIIINGNGTTMGLLVDDIVGSGEYDPATLDAPIPSEGVTHLEFVKGLHQGLTTIISIESILSDVDLSLKNKQAAMQGGFHHEPSK